MSNADQPGRPFPDGAAMRPFYRRTFLNRRGHHAGAYVIAEVRRSRHTPSTSIDAVLTLADCRRVVDLDLDFHDPRSRANALHKARLLREVVVAFADAVEAAAAWAETEGQ